MPKHIGLDLGTSNTRMFIKGKGVVLRSPTVVAVDKNTDKVVALGKDAKRMIGKTPANISAFRPIKNGVIADFEATATMIHEILVRTEALSLFNRPVVTVSAPSKCSEVERLALENAIFEAGAKAVGIIRSPLAAAIGAGINISEPKGKMVIDIGGGTTDIAVISLDGIVEKESLKIAGDQFDYAIMRYVQKKYGLLISRSAAEQIKMRIGTLSQSKDSKRMEVKGRSVKTSHPESVIVSSNEILDAVNETVSAILLAVSRVLRSTPPELVSDIMLNGIVMTGGGSLLQGLDKMVERFTGIPTTVAPDAPKCVINGMGKLLDNLSDNLDGCSDLIRDEIKFV